MSDTPVIDRNTFIREWVKDLESGGYEQSRWALSRDGGFCCLGIACITGQRLGIARAAWDAGQSRADSFPGEWFYDFVDDSDNAEGPRFDDDGKAKYAVILNDEEKRDFKYIAQCIRRTYPEAFAEAKA